MPKTKRDFIKLRHEQIMAHIEDAIAFADDLHEIFREHHPDYAEGYSNICLILAQAHEFTEKMKSFI